MAAWATKWRMHQFEQAGSAPVTVWRELRKLQKAITQDGGILEKARKAADAADWQGYIEANGGLDCKRGDRPVKLAKIIDPAANCYGEDIFRIMGVRARVTAKTRLEGWELRRPKAEIVETDDDNKREDLLDSISSGSCVPWSSDNNCTPQLQSRSEYPPYPLNKASNFDDDIRFVSG